MHYNLLVFSVPTFVSALTVPSSGVLSRVHNPQCIQFTFKIYNFWKSVSLNITYLLVRSGYFIFFEVIKNKLLKTILITFSILYYDYLQIKIFNFKEDKITTTIKKISDIQ
jgi:hypothetical protein